MSPAFLSLPLTRVYMRGKTKRNIENWEKKKLDEFIPKFIIELKVN